MPIPPDIQYEERCHFTDRNYNGQSICGWNIDGTSEHEVLSANEEVGIAATAYKVNGYSNKNVATIIVLGFFGQLMIWWDNDLTFEER